MHKHPKIYLGTDDFTDLLLNSNVFVDKSLFIKEFLDNGGKVVLITRPRRWGKSLNMDMLSKFFSIEVDQNGAPITQDQSLNRKLFVGGEVALKSGGVKSFAPLDIAFEQEIVEKYQGQFPVVSLSLKDVKESTSYGELLAQIAKALVETFEAHAYLLKSEKLDAHELELFKRYMLEDTTPTDVTQSLRFLSKLLHKHFEQPAFILVDEYDTPINSAYLGFKRQPEVFKKVLNLFGGLFVATFKGNKHLEKGLITGILRIAKANIFSDLNNVREYTVLDKHFSTSYGFTQAEVNELLSKVPINTTSQQIQHWYNGYNFVGDILYNPWSIMCCLENQGQLKHYWIDSGGTALIDAVLLEDKTQEDLQQLVKGESIEREIDSEIIFDELDHPNRLYSLLLLSGYLNPEAEVDPNRGFYRLAIPNYEVRRIYEKRITTWVEGKLNISTGDYLNLAKLLVQGKPEAFLAKLQGFLQQATSVYQTGSAMAEVFYNGFMLCLLSMLSSYYRVESEYESGAGRTDVVLVPKLESNPQALVIEYKVCKNVSQLPATAKAGLAQIMANNYTDKLQTYDHVQRTLAVCIAFSGKKVALASQVVTVK